jgi:hypothetical protein
MAHAAITTSAIILSGLEFVWYFGMLFLLNCHCGIGGHHHHHHHKRQHYEKEKGEDTGSPYQSLQTVKLKK